VLNLIIFQILRIIFFSFLLYIPFIPQVCYHVHVCNSQYWTNFFLYTNWPAFFFNRLSRFETLNHFIWQYFICIYFGRWIGTRRNVNNEAIFIFLFFYIIFGIKMIIYFWTFITFLYPLSLTYYLGKLVIQLF
jgi:hypothetical protein